MYLTLFLTIGVPIAYTTSFLGGRGSIKKQASDGQYPSISSQIVNTTYTSEYKEEVCTAYDSGRVELLQNGWYGVGYVVSYDVKFDSEDQYTSFKESFNIDSNPNPNVYKESRCFRRPILGYRTDWQFDQKLKERGTLDVAYDPDHPMSCYVYYYSVTLGQSKSVNIPGNATNIKIIGSSNASYPPLGVFLEQNWNSVRRCRYENWGPIWHASVKSCGLGSANMQCGYGEAQCQ